MATIVDYHRLLCHISDLDKQLSATIEELASLLVFEGFPEGQEPKLAMTAARSLELYWDDAQEYGYSCDALPIVDIISAMMSFGHITPGMFSAVE